MEEKPEIGQDDFIDDDNFDYDEFVEPQIQTSRKFKKVRSKNKKKWNLDLICALVVKHQIFKDKNKLRIRQISEALIAINVASLVLIS